MDQPQQPLISPQFRPLLITAAAVALLVSLGWGVAWHNLNRLHQADYEDFQRRISQLDAQFAEQIVTMRELLAEYTGSQDARIALEGRLAAAETALERARSDVAQFQSGDWEARYRGEQNRADALAASVAALERRLEEQSAAAERAASEARAGRKQQGELAEARAEIDKLKRQLAHFAAPRATPAPAGDGGESWRASRLDSLRSALAGRSSAQRIPLLKSVVPTIPGGLSGSELASLLAGMDSADAQSAIAALRGHLQPLDAEGAAALEQLLQPADAAVIEQLRQAEDGAAP